MFFQFQLSYAKNDKGKYEEMHAALDDMERNINKLEPDDYQPQVSFVLFSAAEIHVCYNSTVVMTRIPTSHIYEFV